jgi:glutamate mutase epsilon subunit
MPSPIDEIVRRKVIEQWLSGEPRDQIAAGLQIGAGTVSSVVSDYKKSLQDSNIDSVRELVAEARKQGFTINDIAAHIRYIIFS